MRLFTAIALVSAIALGFCLLISVSASAQVELVERKQHPRTIQVDGDAEVEVTPDLVVITLGVESSSSSLEEAKQENDEKSSAVIAALKSSGIQAKDIQSDFFAINPSYDYSTMTTKNYMVRKRITATLRDIPKFENMMSAAITAGANTVQGIDFQTSELKKYRKQARSKAILAAKEKAQELAADLEQGIGKPYSIRELQSGYWSWYNNWWGGAGVRTMSQNIALDGGAQAGTNSVAPGQLKVSARVSVTFLLED